MPISKERKQRGKLITGTLEFDEFYKLQNIGDGISGFYEGEFEVKDSFNEGEKHTAVVLHDCEYDDIGPDGEIADLPHPSKVAFTFNSEQLKRILAEAREMGPFTKNTVLTIYYVEDKDTDKGNPMKVFNIYRTQGTRVPFGD